MPCACSSPPIHASSRATPDLSPAVIRTPRPLSNAPSLVPAGLFRPGQVVFDIVYTPLKTKLLADAETRGCTIIPGVEMFVNQAVLQFERFTGVDAPVEIMRQVVLERLQS